MKKVTSKDFFGFKFVGDPQISPDGSKVLFNVSEPNEKKNDYAQKLFIYDGKKVKPFTNGPHDGNASWSPDGKKIAFISKRSKDKGNDLLVIDADGGEAQVVSHFDNGITSTKWLNNKALAALVVEKEKKDPKDDVHVINKIPFWFNGEGFIYDLSFQLYMVNLNGKKKKLTNEKGFIESFVCSPDGKKVAFVEVPDIEKNPMISDLFIMEIGKKPLKLTNSKMSVSQVVWSPDSTQLAFTASDLKHGSFTNHRIYKINAKKNARMRKVCDIDLSKWNAVNSDSRGNSPLPFYWVGEWIYFTVTNGPAAKIYRVKAKGGKVEEVIGGKRSVDGFSISKNETKAFVAMDFTSLDELYILKGEKEKQITHINSKHLQKLSLSTPEHFYVKTSDGKKIDTWMMKPVNFDPKKKYPAILEIHGGPKTAYGYGFFLEFQILTSHGYVVIFSNPRGSDGYGEEFSNIFGAYGKRDYQDLMEVMDEAVKKYKFIDEKRLGVTGGSYGGYMTNWIVGQTSRFKAAVSQRSISNWTSFFGTTDIGYFFGPEQLGGDPWTNAKGYAEMSPLTYADKVDTPLLLIHSMEDKRCWMAEALQFFTALKYFGKEAELALFPDETHELSRSGKPLHRIKRLDLILDWFESHLKENKN
jgi:dipeptidyl aminopeptidase/acylaminoacyl peptidase